MSNNKTEDVKDVDCSCFTVTPSKSSCPPVQNVSHPLRYYEFTAEEIKALEECDKESFYNRCLPLSTLFATLTYAGIKYGVLNQNPHFGVVPKVVLAAILGHWYGRLSCIPECEARLRRLSANSYLGHVMRQYNLDKKAPKDCKKK